MPGFHEDPVKYSLNPASKRSSVFRRPLCSGSCGRVEGQHFLFWGWRNLIKSQILFESGSRVIVPSAEVYTEPQVDHLL